MINFISFKINKSMLIYFFILLILITVVILLTTVNIGIPVLTDKKVETGVQFDEKDVSGLTKKEVEGLLNELSDDYYISEKNAYLDPITRGVIPGLPEKELDIEKTVEKILTADTGESVEPEYIISPPDINLHDYLEAPIYQGNPEKDKVAFACNVAWGTEYLSSMLEVLESHEVKITFFLEGRWLANNPKSANMIKEQGHEIGNHGYHHYMMSEISREQVREEIVSTNEVIEDILKEEVKLFAPPAGDFDEDVLRVAAKLDLHTILWSLDTVDWQKPGVSYMIDKILSNIHPGAIILMHPTEDTVTALEKILTGLKDQELQVTTVSDLISEKNY